MEFVKSAKIDLPFEQGFSISFGVITYSHSAGHCQQEVGQRQHQQQQQHQQHVSVQNSHHALLRRHMRQAAGGGVIRPR